MAIGACTVLGTAPKLLAVLHGESTRRLCLMKTLLGLAPSNIDEKLLHLRRRRTRALTIFPNEQVRHVSRALGGLRRPLFLGARVGPPHEHYAAFRNESAVHRSTAERQALVCGRVSVGHVVCSLEGGCGFNLN